MVKRDALSDEDILKLTRPGVWIFTEHESVQVQVIGPDEPLDRIAGMISDDDFDATGLIMRVSGDG